MNSPNLLQEQIAMLKALPFVEALGIGGSQGALISDDLSDLDFFILVADKDFFHAVATFAQEISYPCPPLAFRRRGFVPDFGFQFSVVFPDVTSIDYHINCAASLRRTPMARKTSVLFDRTGIFTKFHETLPGSALLEVSEYAADAQAEVLIEMLRIHKYAKRKELTSLMHRLERLRLVSLGLERFLSRDEPYSPHDADKWVARDLSDSTRREVMRTFSRYNGQDVAGTLQVLCAGLITRLARLQPLQTAYEDAFHNLVAETTSLLQSMKNTGDGFVDGFEMT